MEDLTKFTNMRIKKNAEELPIELRRALEALSDEVRLGIFFALFKYGEMSFSQLRQELEIPTNNSGYLSYHLRKLENSALIKNDYSKKTGITNYSFYDVTEFGEKVIDGLMKSIEIDYSLKEKLKTLKLPSNTTGFPSHDMASIRGDELTQIPLIDSTV
jgi:DNA-binding HxlR family transcriptional regulator